MYPVQCFLVYLVLCNLPHFHHPRKKTLVPVTSHSLVPLPQTIKITNVFSGSMDLPIQDISYKGNLTIYNHLWLLSLNITISRFIYIVACTSTLPLITKHYPNL